MKQSEQVYKFKYDENLLKQCAEDSGLALFLKREDHSYENDYGGIAIQNHRQQRLSYHQLPTKTQGMGDEACLELFHQHAAFYKRHHLVGDFNFEKITKSIDENPETSLQGPNQQTQKLTSIEYQIGKRLKIFVRSVIFVHQHNSNASIGHTVALNRFSDRMPHEILSGYVPPASHGFHGDNITQTTSIDEKQLHTGLHRHLLAQDETTKTMVTSLETTDSIIKVANNLAIGRGSMKKLSHHKTYEKIYADSTVLHVPPDRPTQFHAPQVQDPNLDGTLLSIRKRKKHGEQDPSKTVVQPTEDDPSLQIIDPPTTAANKEFDKHLNWATAQNPDGVPIVNPPFDQGGCGSCWAFAAAGSLEASASRRAAYLAYQTQVQKLQDSRQSLTVSNATNITDGSSEKTLNGSVLDDIETQSVIYAQQVEHEAAQMLNLSVQELVDCDKAGDQGCTGGNPLLAFYFIHKHGLTSWSKYPYVGFEDTCKDDLVHTPVASVKSWGIISPNHEKHMELVLRYIGPIAVGINGASSSFLHYSGGIYDKPNCKQGANHALLITGYGQEVAPDGTIVKFWYARNSWSTDWGENGYVRVKRGDGHKGSLGVCGIARSPSVALGGMILDGQYLETSTRHAGDTADDDTITETRVENFCSHLGLRDNKGCLSSVGWIDSHRALSVGLGGILLGMISIVLLAGDCRRRRRIFERREQRRSIERERLQRSMESKPSDENGRETSPLLESPSKDNKKNYGTR